MLLKKNRIRSQYSRTSEDIKSMIKIAKLSERQLTEVTQVLYCGESVNNPDWKLLELNNTLLSAIEEGQVLAFKGWYTIQTLLMKL